MPLDQTLRATTRIPLPLEPVFAFFSDASNLERITPAFLSFQYITPLPIEMRPGARIEYRIRLFGVPMRWCTHIEVWDPPHRFVDNQEKGPYAKWNHTHSFRVEGDETVMEDTVVYRLPFGALGLVALPLVRRQVKAIFAYREVALRKALGLPEGS